MDKAQIAREKAQKEAKEAARAAGYNCALIATVGFGKGKVMLDLAKELIKKYNIKSILYVCDNRRLRDSPEEGFPQEIEKWGDATIKKMTRLKCYQTTCKWSGEQFDLLLADEADFGMTPVYSNVFFKNKFKYKILVTGTLSPTKRKMMKEIVPISFKLSTTDAEDRGIINKTNYYLYNYPMSEEESTEYDRLTRMIGVKMNSDDENGARFFTGQRREMLFNLNSSYKHCRKLMRWLWEKDKKTRLVVFAQRTEQADRLCRWSFHGKNEKNDNLAKFQSGDISAISVVSKIKRGINLKNANTAIFESLDGSTTEFEQRGGRMKRLPQSQVAKIIFLVPWIRKVDAKGKIFYKESIVGEWVRKCTSNLGNINFIDLKI